MRRWRDEHDLPLDSRSARAHFETAYDLSGGLPAPFARAADYAAQLGTLPDDLRTYRDGLLEQLPDAFSRLLGYDEEDLRPRLLEALSNMHLGIATASDTQVVVGHRWHALLATLEASGLRLRSQVIGRKALQMLRATRAQMGPSPEVLYEQGDYKACAALCEMTGRGATLLGYTALMLAEVFGDAPRHLYFGPTVRWRRVITLAEQGASMCSTEPSRAEFERWKRIAQVFLDSPDKVPAQAKGNATVVVIENHAIRLGIRILAVAGDRNPVTAAYSAIPLIEDVLRHYVCLVLALSSNGSGFSALDRSHIDAWWTEPKQFQVPGVDDQLTATSLALLSAAQSSRLGHALFDNPKQLSQLLTLLDQGRNLLGHHVTTPDEKLSKDLVSQASRLLDRLCSHADSELRISELEGWVKAPRRFLIE